VSLRARVGRIGTWSSDWGNLQGGATADASELAEAAAELEELGYGAVWIGGGPPARYAIPLLAATSRTVVATGILSIWQHEAAEVASQRAEIERQYPGRFLLGLGVSHRHLAEHYAHPLPAMRSFLSTLDHSADPVPEQARVLAALGPRMLALSRDRAAGAHPYLVTAEHTALAREILGPQPLLAPALTVVLDPNISSARDTARGHLSGYLAMPNYTDNLLRLGFAEDDLRGGGSDRLLDAVFGLGDADAIAERVDAFLAAGADHVAIQVVGGDTRNGLPREAWRRLAGTLLADTGRYSPGRGEL
jgi:probable F420-dependent oxidoreductase